MKKKIFVPLALLLILTGCDYNDRNFKELDDMVAPTDVKKIEYTLTDADYATIASNATNRALATTAGVSAELTALGTTKAFSETLPASTYLPAFINAKWYTADDGSSVKVTYNEGQPVPDYIAALRKASIYKVTAADYKSVWGDGSSTTFFTPVTSARANVPGILLKALPNAVAGDIVAVDYNESENEPSGAVIAINEDFNFITATVNPAAIDGWQNVMTKGSGNTFFWGGRVYSGNGYVQASANNHKNGDGELEVYLITPQIKVSAGLNLTYDACYGYYMNEGGRVATLVSSNLTGFTPEAIQAATWDDISSSFDIADKHVGGYGTLAPAGSASLDKYVGKNIYIAFRYSGNGLASATTTEQIDNIVVKSEASGAGEDKFVASTGLFTFNGTAWAAYSGNGYMVTKTDYTAMGLSYDNFSAGQADHYLPTFFNQKFGYAQKDDIKAGVYKYYVSPNTTIMADEYQYSGTEWVKSTGVAQLTDQFVRSNQVWNFDPSIVITLKPARSQPAVSLYYQAIVDYVAKEFGTDYYQSGYTNAEFYYGASAYQNNIDLRVSAWRTTCAAGPTAYASYSDADLEALMRERLKDAFIPALKALHGDMAPVSGVDVLCTINFGIYTGVTISDCTHQIQYKVTAPGQFEYVEGSFKPL